MQARWRHMEREDALGECVVNPRALGRHCIDIVEHKVVMVEAAHQQHACVQQRPAVEAQVCALLQKHYVEVDTLVLRCFYVSVRVFRSEKVEGFALQAAYRQEGMDEREKACQVLRAVAIWHKQSQLVTRAPLLQRQCAKRRTQRNESVCASSTIQLSSACAGCV